MAFRSSSPNIANKSRDDPRYLDWQLYARSDRYYVKRFEDETNLRCLVLLDGSRSMEFAGEAYSKFDYVRTLAATLAYFLIETARRRRTGAVLERDRRLFAATLPGRSVAEAGCSSRWKRRVPGMPRNWRRPR